MSRVGKYNRKWLRLLFFMYPLVSLPAFIMPFIPGYILHKLFARMKGFIGSVDSIHINPFRIEVSVKGLTLDTLDISGERRGLISAESIHIKIDWIKLWSGTLWVDAKCTAPVFSISKSAAKSLSEAPLVSAPTGNPLLSFDPGMDIVINSAEISQGKLVFTDPTIHPQVFLHVDNIDVAVSCVPIGKNTTDTMVSDVMVKADLYGGKLNARLKADLLSPEPEFTLDAGIGDVNMILLNDFFRAYGKFDIHKGTMNMHTVVTASHKEYKGYVEPVIEDLEVMGPEDSHDNLLKFLWKAIIGAVAGLLEDHSKDKIEACINFEAPFKNPGVHIGIAVVEVLASAFVHGLTPYMRNEVKINV